jgi:hypothetical protein
MYRRLQQNQTGLQNLELHTFIMHLFHIGQQRNKKLRAIRPDSIACNQFLNYYDSLINQLCRGRATSKLQWLEQYILRTSKAYSIP